MEASEEEYEMREAVFSQINLGEECKVREMSRLGEATHAVLQRQPQILPA